MATKTTAQLRSLIIGARFGRHEEKALLDLIDNAAIASDAAKASPATAAGTDAAIINDIVAQLETLGIYTG